ncbi:hypothetical protein H4R27_001549 [Coemansia aciculifera]|nr:hypothetical protein H4R27_001549 [Coemansia aciculifera]
MSTLSPFQLLPQHVVQLIVNHVAGSSRLVFDGVRVNSHEYRALLKPLLWVSHNFRAVAYSRFCNNFELNPTSLTFGDLDRRYLGVRRSDVDYRTRNYLGYSTHHLAKDVTVFLDERTVYSGEALEVISRAPYAGCPFSLARKVAFIFVKEATDRADEDIWNDLLRAEANIDAFVNRIKLIAPLVAEIRVQPADRGGMPSISNQHFSDLASRLYQTAHCVEYGYGLDVADSMRLQLDIICNLTHISYASSSSIASTYQFLQLARKNALTLQSLRFACEDDMDILGLVQDAEGNHVAYPRLLALDLRAVSDADELRRPVFQGTAPFPALRRLHIHLECPFDDDTLFRGNSATLRVLDMRLDSVSVSMLQKYKVFVPGSHPRLQNVKILYTKAFESELLASPTEALEIAYNIGSGTPVWEYAQYGPLRDPVPMFPLLGNHACIQVLSLPTLRPNTWDVITLIKSFPLLSDLHTSPPSLGPIPDGTTLDELPGHIRSNYAPMGRRFCCWHLKGGYVHDYTELATCVLLLALACPNFDYMAVGKKHRELFMEAMQEIIAEPEFSHDASRLGRLLFHGWKGC